MGVLVKTKQVSDKLGVNPSTIHRWVKFFELPCLKNEHGHYLFSDKDINQLRQIKEQLSNGLTMEDIAGNKQVYKTENEQIANKLADLERKVDRKADEVVSYQLFQHRNEIDELMKKVIELEKKLDTLQNPIPTPNPTPNQFEINLPIIKEKSSHRNKWVLQLFGLLR